MYRINYSQGMLLFPTKNHDATIIADCVKILKEEVKELNLIVFALNGQSPRLEGSLEAMITIIQQMFTAEIWNNLEDPNG
jgi:hypothetical protein